MFREPRICPCCGRLVPVYDFCSVCGERLSVPGPVGQVNPIGASYTEDEAWDAASQLETEMLLAA